MTCKEIAARLSAAGISNAAAEARALAAHFCDLSEQALRLAPDLPLPDEGGALAQAVQQRESHVPLQYLLGRWPFFRQEYEVSPHCLIPRQDTERLVELLVQMLPPQAHVIDLCTGSGCIAISLLCERPDVTAVAVELYPETLELARRNAQHNNIAPGRLTFVSGDVLSGNFPLPPKAFDAIISNPPYIPTRDLATLAPEVGFEPRAALDGGEDGLTFYRRILWGEDYRASLADGGRFYFEIGYDQGHALCTLAEKHRDECRIFQDYGNCDRVAVVQPAPASRI